MKNLILGVKRFIADEEGVTMVEYGLIAALIAIVAITAVTGAGNAVKGVFTLVCTKLNATGITAVTCS